ncbi:unnamed protein product [Rotaria socialis]|uniref:Uncharacterized protein n=1 Tax=Rotaria socialis TaxID=392032 RepID=A0A818E055_9BILA|nr:unnamed protein product [Rotaria socialis]CAF4569173.1 unnamed protein product [Rotaria socialis]
MENDRSLLLRELFNNPRTILKELIRGARLPLNYLDTIYHSDFDEQNFDMKDGTFLSCSIKEVAGQIGLSPGELIKYPRIKQQSIVNDQIREFAKLHITDENYDLLNFIAKQQLLVSFNEPEHKKLQIVFEKIYTILNRLSRGEHQHRLNPNDHVRVLYDDAQFYGVILDIFNSKTNKWRTVFDRREHAFEWMMVHRIFKS